MKRLRKLLESALFISIIIAGVAGTFTLLSGYKHTPEPIIFVPESANQYERAQASTALLETETGFGSGIVIHRDEKTFIWTAAHVVEHANTAEVSRLLHSKIGKSGKLVFPARVIARFPEVDSALLAVGCPLTAFGGFEWAEDDTAVGSPLFLVGNLYGPNFDGSVMRGVLSQTSVVPKGDGWPWKLVDQGDFNAAPGASGGPVIRESDGKVIGILVGGPGRGGDGISCFIPIREIRRVAEPQAFGYFLHPSSVTLPDAVIDLLADKAKVAEETTDTIFIIR